MRSFRCRRRWGFCTGPRLCGRCGRRRRGEPIRRSWGGVPEPAASTLESCLNTETSGPRHPSVLFRQATVLALELIHFRFLAIFLAAILFEACSLLGPGGDADAQAQALYKVQRHLGHELASLEGANIHTCTGTKLLVRIWELAPIAEIVFSLVSLLPALRPSVCVAALFCFLGHAIEDEVDLSPVHKFRWTSHQSLNEVLTRGPPCKYTPYILHALFRFRRCLRWSGEGHLLAGIGTGTRKQKRDRRKNNAVILHFLASSFGFPEE